MPKDKITLLHQGFAFVEFETVEDAEYAIRIMSNVKLHGRHIKINRAAKDKLGDEEFNAKLFVGNLDLEVDEKMLFDTFSQFGAVLSAKVMTEADSDKSRGFGFITFDSFEASDRAIESMNGQYVANRPINVGYAFKKDSGGATGKGERHGSRAERELAAKSSLHRIRALPAASANMAPMPTPTYLGGRASNVTAALPPPPPPSGIPPPPPVPAHLQHHPSRAIPYSVPPPPPFGAPAAAAAYNMPPPPPPQFQGGYPQQPPAQFRPPPLPPQFASSPQPPFQGYPPQPQYGQFQPPPPPAQFYAQQQPMRVGFPGHFQQPSNFAPMQMQPPPGQFQYPPPPPGQMA